MDAIDRPPLPAAPAVRTLFFMRFSHVLAVVLLSCSAVACYEGEPAVPERGPSPVPSTSAAAGSSGSAQGPGANANGPVQGPAGATTGTTTGSSSGSPSPSSPSPAQLTEQAATGQALFQEHCAGCHGGSVSISPFDTAADVDAYVSTNMPRGAPGSLSESEYFAIVAFDLAANGVDLKGETLDASNAASVRVR